MTTGVARFSIAAACALISSTTIAWCASTWTSSQDSHNILHTETSKVAVTDKHVELTSGAMLIEPKRESTIVSPLARVVAKRKSLVFVRVRQGTDHIFVLLGPASVYVGSHHSHLNSGDEAIVTDHEPVYKDLVGEDEIGRRRVRMTSLPTKKTMVLTEFSLVQLIEREPLLYRFVHSTEKESKAIKDRLLKMAAVLNIVTSRHGPYTTTPK